MTLNELDPACATFEGDCRQVARDLIANFELKVSPAYLDLTVGAIKAVVAVLDPPLRGAEFVWAACLRLPYCGFAEFEKFKAQRCWSRFYDA